jgi:pSer/pThr/pTyr-binding forkhead associated (FHA) protein
MIRCQACGTENLVRSLFCDQCGTKLHNDAVHETDVPNARPQTAEVPLFKPTSVTSVGVPPLVPEVSSDSNGSGPLAQNSKATLTIERGDSVGAEFVLSSTESNIGRWDADNGIFPDIDLDTVDSEAKVSRRHARIIFRDGKYFVEDLGSTNGTYVNRGRRLLPGIPQVLADGDEIIVGKTFFRFHISN